MGKFETQGLRGLHLNKFLGLKYLGEGLSIGLAA
ncbi:unnamed protein product [Spirodela intermedia]|uniref:Uncharacterized protein n=1 Tax=Spirodela intermedia TaxID=51605 RepID=A0ABN7EC83_SPIIN|nr:unnamed protein product [Spirodela intermedia]